MSFFKRREKENATISKTDDGIKLTKDDINLVYKDGSIVLQMPGRAETLCENDLIKYSVVDTLTLTIQGKLKHFNIEISNGIVKQFCSEVLRGKTVGIIKGSVNYNRGDEFGTLNGKFFYFDEYVITKERDRDDGIAYISPGRRLCYFHSELYGCTLKGYQKLLEKIGCKSYDIEELKAFIRGDDVRNINARGNASEVVEATMEDVIRVIRHKMPESMRDCSYAEMIQYILGYTQW